MVRQWYGASREDALLGFLMTVELVRELDRDIQVGPWTAAEVAALGFWARGSDVDVEALTERLAAKATKEGLRVAAADYAGAITP